jgi:HEAT repeat protein
MKRLISALIVQLCIQAPAAPIAAQTVRSQNARLEVLLEATTNEDWNVRRRAVQEFCATSSVQPDTWLRFARAASGVPSRDGQIDAFVSFSQLGPKVVPTLMQVLEEQTSDRVGEGILICLGRLGSDATAVVPLLTNTLTDPNMDKATKAVMRVVLASLGWAGGSNLARIEEQLAKGDDTSLATLRTLALVRHHDWVTTGIGARVLKLIDEPSDMTANAIWAAPACAGKVARLPEYLNDWETKARREEMSRYYRVSLGLVRMKIEPGRERGLLREVLGYIGSERTDRSVMQAVQVAAWTMVDERFIRLLAEFLAGEDRDVCLGAARMLGIIGMPAKVTVPQLLKIGKEAPDKELRKAAFLALANMADYKGKQWEELESALSTESSTSVKGAIEEALRLIQVK